MNTNKKKGKQGEEVALAWYIDQGRSLLERNYTIWGGEIDILMENKDTLVCIEVKTVDYIDDLHGYITKAKLGHVMRTLETYLHECPTQKDIQVDVVFVKDNEILEVFHNVTIK